MHLPPQTRRFGSGNAFVEIDASHRSKACNPVNILETYDARWLFTLAACNFGCLFYSVVCLWPITVCGTFSPDAVRKVQREIADEDPHGAWIDVDDLNDREVDGKIVSAVHYNRPEGYITLGQRFARQGHALVNGKKPAENGKPTGDESE